MIVICGEEAELILAVRLENYFPCSQVSLVEHFTFQVLKKVKIVRIILFLEHWRGTKHHSI
jgi:hypothetical protein